MGFLDDAEKAARDAEAEARKHPGTADRAIDEAGKVADEKTANRYDKEVRAGEQRAESYIGGESGRSGEQSGQPGGQPAQPGQAQQSGDQSGQR